METEYIFQLLQEDGYIDFDKTIPSDVIMPLLECEKTEGWDFLGKFLSLKEYIELQGFYCTSKGCKSGGLRILPANQMAKRTENVLKNVERKHKKTIEIMSNADLSGCTKHERQEAYHATHKITLALHALKNALSDI